MSDMQRQTVLRPLDFCVLVVLCDGENYGYGIVKAVAATEGGSLRLAPGNLYQALARLRASGWIQEAGRRDAGEGGKPRRLYRITALGRQVARAEAGRLKAMLPRLRRLGLCS